MNSVGMQRLDGGYRPLARKLTSPEEYCPPTLELTMLNLQMFSRCLSLVMAIGSACTLVPGCLRNSGILLF